MIQLVIFIMIVTKLSKKVNTGFPSSSLIEMAIPKAKLNAIKPEIKNCETKLYMYKKLFEQHSVEYS